MRFHKILLQTDAENSAFYLEKQKSFITKKKISSHCQYQNKKALFTDPIFREGFVCSDFQPDSKLSLITFRLRVAVMEAS